VDVARPTEGVDLAGKLPSLAAAEQLASDMTPAAVLCAFQRYRLDSITDACLQSNQASVITPAAAAAAAAAAAGSTRPAVRQKNDTDVTKKPGEIV